MVPKRARFLFLLGIFIRSIQFLSAVGFTLETLYDAFDRTVLVAEEALKGIL